MNKRLLPLIGLLMFLTGIASPLKAQNEQETYEYIDTFLIGKYVIVGRDVKMGIYDIEKHENVTPLEFEYLSFIEYKNTDGEVEICIFSVRKGIKEGALIVTVPNNQITGLCDKSVLILELFSLMRQKCA